MMDLPIIVPNAIDYKLNGWLVRLQVIQSVAISFPS